VTRVFVAAAVLVLGVAVVGTTRGVEGERYIAANEAILAELPVYPGSRVRSVQSTARRESESPWSPVLGYGTLQLVTLPEAAQPDAVAAFYERELQPEWMLVDKVTEPPFAAGPILLFRRGEAEVGINLESWRGHLLEVYVDHGGG
jgi:hypothetical protein